MTTVQSILLLLLCSHFLDPVSGHLAIWDIGLYGLNGTEPGVNDYNNALPCNPLRQNENLTLSEWFGHGFLDFPPSEGDFMELPAGGNYTGDITCNRYLSHLRDPINNIDPTKGVDVNSPELQEYPCDNPGVLHTILNFGDPVNDTLLGGCALAIAYESNVTLLQPENFTVFTTNASCPWWRATVFQIPQDLPPCPTGGCHCTFNWIHTANNYNAEGRTEGYASEMYHTLYRCNVTGAKTDPELVKVLPGQITTECSEDSSQCITGPKQPHYWSQLDGNNNFATIPPLHNMNYGYENGPQNDIFSYATSGVSPIGTVPPLVVQNDLNFADLA